MNVNLSGKFTLEKILIYAIIAAVVIAFGFITYLFIAHFSKNIQLTSPDGGENWQIGQTYDITWKANGISKVGIVLFKGNEAKWIAKDVFANLGRFEWKIYPGQQYGDDYWIGVFEYPWKKGNKITYSKGAFAIIFSELGSCENLSLSSEWPYVPSDMPNVRKVFITDQSFSGNLGGLDGADKKCQAAAEQKELSGQWQAFLGGDGENETAVKRMESGPRKTEGVFVEAAAELTLTRGATCNRLLGKNINEFTKKLSALLLLDSEKFSASFLNDLKGTWLGRIDGRSAENCTTIASVINATSRALAEKYSYTSTCQNWTKDTVFSDGYPVPFGGAKPAFPRCYTKEGKATDAVGIAGLGIGTTGGAKSVDSLDPFQGKFCNTAQKLICVEQ